MSNIGKQHQAPLQQGYMGLLEAVFEQAALYDRGYVTQYVKQRMGESFAKKHKDRIRLLVGEALRKELEDYPIPYGLAARRRAEIVERICNEN